MKRYFYDPESDNLIVIDETDGRAQQTKILPRLRNIRVFVGTEAGVLDGLEDGGEGDHIRPPRVPKTSKEKKERAPRKCGNCGQPGHIARKCPNSAGAGHEG